MTDMKPMTERALNAERARLEGLSNILATLAEIREALDGKSGVAIQRCAKWIPSNDLREQLVLAYNRRAEDARKVGLEVEDIPAAGEQGEAGPAILFQGKGWMQTSDGVLTINASTALGATVELDSLHKGFVREGKWEWCASKRGVQRVLGIGGMDPIPAQMTPVDCEPGPSTGSLYLPRPGEKYRHHSGRVYQVEQVVAEEEHGIQVIHRGEDGKLWTRRLENFVGLNDLGQPRFTLI